MALVTNPAITGIFNSGSSGNNNYGNGTNIGIGTAGSVTAASTKDLQTIVLFGDSITRNNNIANGNGCYQHQLSDIGIFTWANILLKNAFKVVRNAGIAGDTTTQMLARIQTDVLAYSPRYVWFMGGINNCILGTPLATTIADYKAIFNTIQAAGSTLILCTMLPNDYINGRPTAEKETYAYMNQFIREYAANNPNVIFIDMFKPYYKSDTSCGVVAGTFTDNTHPGTVGAFNLGTYVYQVLSTKFQGSSVQTSGADLASSTYAYGNIDPFPSPAGTTGVTTGTTTVVTGTVPTGYWFQGQGDSTNCAATLSLVARSDVSSGQSYWRTVLTWTAAQATQATWAFRRQLAIALPSSVPIGASINWELDMQLSSITNAGGLEVFLDARDSGNAILDSAKFVYQQSINLAEPAFSGVIAIRNFVIPANTTNFMIRVIVRNQAGTNGGITVDIGNNRFYQVGIS